MPSSLVRTLEVREPCLHELKLYSKPCLRFARQCSLLCFASGGAGSKSCNNKATASKGFEIATAPSETLMNKDTFLTLLGKNSGRKSKLLTGHRQLRPEESNRRRSSPARAPGPNMTVCHCVCGKVPYPKAKPSWTQDSGCKGCRWQTIRAPTLCTVLVTKESVQGLR